MSNIVNPNLIRISFPEPRDGYAGAAGTMVRTADGQPIPGVTKITLNPLEVNSVISAEIEVCVSLDDFEAHPLLGVATLVRSAARHGLKVFDADGNELKPEPEDVVVHLLGGRTMRVPQLPLAPASERRF